MNQQQYEEIKNKILKRLNDELPFDIFYHSVDHTLDVLNTAEELGKAENLPEEDLLLLKLAALFHDTGFLKNYNQHEEASAKMAEEILRQYGVNDAGIEKIKKLILATKPGIIPETLPEKILIDADLDYLGREDFIPISQKLYLEWKNKGKVKDLHDFYKIQYDFLKNHRFHTSTSKKRRQKVKEKHISKLKEILYGTK